MATPQQIQANRANARRSTGPRTPKGKAASAANALKHGLCAQRTVLPAENIEEFQALVAEYEQQFQPATAVERTLIRQLADTEWRMRRVPRLEAAVLAEQLQEARRYFAACPGRLPAEPALAETCVLGRAVSYDACKGDALTKLSRYETRLSQRYFKALDHLQKAQDRRRHPASPSAAKTATRQTNPISTAPAPTNGAGKPARVSAAGPADVEPRQTNPISTPRPPTGAAGKTAHLPAAELAETQNGQTKHR